LTIGKLLNLLDGNAIVGEDAVKNDPMMSLGDARFSVSFEVFCSCDIQNGKGLNVHDPRTGEIMEKPY
jgi:hypothetical protein